MKAVIKAKKEVATETLRVTFDLLGQKFNFLAGQYTFVTIPNPPFTDEDGNRRHFSISSPPEDKDISITTRLRSTAFKRSLAKIPLGYEVDLEMPVGEFILPPRSKKPLVFLAGGIGITPFMSILPHIHNQNLPYHVTLIYSNKDLQSTAYLKELERWVKEIANFKLILTMTRDPKWPGEKRRIDDKFIKEYLPNPKAYLYYVSGPPDFVKAISEVIEKAGIERANIRTEQFSGY